jgi:exopolysaccharide biosynthesis polyprenyl glycosylphosphotransferase
MAAIGHQTVGIRGRRRAAIPRIVTRALQRRPDASRRNRAPRWLVAAVLLGDLLAVVIAFGLSQTIFPVMQFPTAMLGPSGAALAWPILLAIRGSYTTVGLSARHSGRQVTRAVITLVALFAVVAAVTEQTVAMTTVVIVAPLLLLISLATRRFVVWRLRRLRREGVAVQRVLAVGPGEAVSELVDQLSFVTDHPMVVVGACAEGGALTEDIPVAGIIDPTGAASGVHMLGGPEIATVTEAAQSLRADTVCVVGGSMFASDRLRALSWTLRDAGVDLVTAPGLVDVASHRVGFDRAGVVTLLHMRAIAPTGPRRIAKFVADRVLAACLLMLLAVPMLLISAAIWGSSEGPALFRQQRIGRDGRPFTMFKFRTMVDGAEQHRDDLMSSNEHDGVMFKIRNDPRVTPLGRVLRRSSLDELPQLLNVLRGDMSLVGPRPPLPDEVALYGPMERRRLLVRPGMTGLWQVSGRSTLNWDETVRLDLRYIDNWTFGTDLRLLWRTVSAVVRGTGAY